MPFFPARTSLHGLLIFLGLLLVGCAVDVGNSGHGQSLEAAVQTVLFRQGYYQGPIDGLLGPGTSRAIRNYQRDHRLTPTGTINSALTESMGLTAQVPVCVRSIPAYYVGYAGPAFYSPPAVVNVGWGAGWPSRGYGGYWSRGWGAGGWGGWRGNCGGGDGRGGGCR